MKKKQEQGVCPCGGFGRAAPYKECCEPFINGTESAPGAEQLMRSRYTAYALGNAAYVLATWHRSTRPAQLELEAPGKPHGTQWLGLKIHSHTQLDETHAQVMFTARYREAGRAHHLKEHSRFVFEDGLWFYVDGAVESPSNQTGR